MTAFFRIAQVVAVLVIAFFVAVISTIDLFAFQQAELVAGAVVWLILFGILVKAEKDATNRLVMCTVRTGR